MNRHDVDARDAMRGGSESTLDDFCEMVEWTAERFGIDAVGFGTDFHAGHSPDANHLVAVRDAGPGRARCRARSRTGRTGSTARPWFPGSAGRVERRGFSSEDLRKLAGNNWLRLFRESFGPMPA